MPSLQDSLLIFSDLDGSLLDIHTYEWQPAMPRLDTLWITRCRLFSAAARPRQK